MTKITRWKGAKRELVATVEWRNVKGKMPVVRFVSDGKEGEGEEVPVMEGAHEGDQEQTGEEGKFLRRSKFHNAA